MGFSVQREALKEESVAHPIDKPFFRNGFTIAFAKGYKVSVQFGEMNYCTKPDERGHSTTAEVAVIAPDGSWATKAVWAGALTVDLDDYVAADVSPEDLVTILLHVRDWLEVNHVS